MKRIIALVIFALLTIPLQAQTLPDVIRWQAEKDAPELPKTPVPLSASTGVVLAPMLTWQSAGATLGYDVSLGTSATPPFVASVTTASYVVGTLLPGTTYYWQIIAKNPKGTMTGPVWKFITATVLPPPPSCTFVLSSTSQTATAAGGSGVVSVTASATTCAWTATSSASWLTVSSGATGTGTVTYTATVNTGAQRVGTLTVAGQTFTVTQAAAAIVPPVTSADCTRITSGSGAITTADGAKWTLSGTSIFRNGLQVNGAGSVLVISALQIYTLGTNASWYARPSDGSGNWGVVAGDPCPVALPPPIGSAWTPPVQLTTNGGLQYGIATVGDTIHTVHGDGSVYYKQGSVNASTGVTTWGADVAIASGSVILDRPIVVEGANVYVLYARDLTTITDACCSRVVGNLYFKKSTDGGTTFGAEVKLTTSGKVYRVALAASGSNLFVVYQDHRSGTTADLYGIRSTTNGSSWLAEVKIVSGSGPTGAQRPDALLVGTTATIVWMDGRNTPSTACFGFVGCTQIYQQQSADGGATWPTAARALFPQPTIYQGRPIVARSSAGTWVLTWEQSDAAYTHNTPYVSRSTTSGGTWSAPQALLTLATGGGHPYVGATGTLFLACWHDFRGGNPPADIFCRSSSDDGVTIQPEERLSNNAGDSLVPMIAFTSSRAHVIWGDTTSGSAQTWWSAKAIAAAAPPPPPPPPPGPLPSGALVQQANLVQVGSFGTSQVSGTCCGGQAIDEFAYANGSIAFNPANQSLFVVGHDWGQHIAEISIPAFGGTATLRQPFVDALYGKLNAITPGLPTENDKIGGLFVSGSMLLVSAFDYYDGTGSASQFSHFSRSTTLSSSSVTGPVKVGTLNPAFYGGQFAAIPAAWQAALGGDLLVGQCCRSIISRTSVGPAAFAVKTADLVAGITPTLAQPLVYYDDAHRTLGWGGPTPNPVMSGGTTQVHGTVIPTGTSSLLFFGVTGLGISCYGPGTSDPALAGKVVDAAGDVWCYDPSDSSKGAHAYPYTAYVWAYNLNDLAAVRAGTKQPWDVIPYATWALANSADGVGYDPATGRIFVSARGSTVTINVYRVQ